MNYFVIGAQKSATTWLYQELCNHPSISKFPVKEIHFWNAYEANFPAHLRLGNRTIQKRIFKTDFWRKLSVQILGNKIEIQNLSFFWYFFFCNYSLEWYFGLNRFSKGKLIGDFTPAYSFLKEETVAEISSHYPNSKVVFVLRDPIDRLWSQWRMFVRRNPNTRDLSFREYVLDEKLFFAFFAKEGLNKRCDYRYTIITYSKYFSGRFFLGFYDDIVSGGPAFIDAFDKDVLSLSKKRNQSISQIKVNDSMEVSIPESILNFLKEKLFDQYYWLATNYDGFPKIWFNNRFGQTFPNVNMNKKRKLLICLNENEKDN
jgi:hypothetical protein